MTNKFKVGDKVKVSEANISQATARYTNEIGTVTSIHTEPGASMGTNNISLRVQFPSGRGRTCNENSDFFEGVAA